MGATCSHFCHKFVLFCCPQISRCRKWILIQAHRCLQQLGSSLSSARSSHSLQINPCMIVQFVLPGHALGNSPLPAAGNTQADFQYHRSVKFDVQKLVRKRSFQTTQIKSRFKNRKSLALTKSVNQSCREKLRFFFHAFG
jgi:hypothetical protein